jgi:hypothetical protein
MKGSDMLKSTYSFKSVMGIQKSRQRALHENPINVFLFWELRSQTHECGNWDCGQAIPFLGIFFSNFRYWFFAVCNLSVLLEEHMKNLQICCDPFSIQVNKAQ